MCARYSILHNNVTGTLTEALANTHPEEDSSLSERLIKAMDASTKYLFTVEEQLSGYRIFKSIEDSDSTQKYDTELKLLYIQWMSIKRSNNNTIRAFAARVQTYAAQIDGTNYKVKFKALARRCTKGLGSSFKSINKMVNETVIIPDG